jgi:hypothetical protein
LLVENKHLTLDLSSIRWIDPFGILFLRIILEKLLNQNNILTIIFNNEIVNYIVRMNFNQFFSDNNNIEFNPEIRNITIRRSHLEDRLLELTDFSVTDDDEVENVTDQIIGIVSGRIERYERISDRFRTDIVETISNIQVHSTRYNAMVILQSYGNSIILVIGDDGIGIREGLKREGEGMNDPSAIEKALQPQVTGRDDLGGMGLTEIVEYVRQYNDKICIRSRGGYFIIENNTSR